MFSLCYLLGFLLRQHSQNPRALENPLSLAIWDEWPSMNKCMLVALEVPVLYTPVNPQKWVTFASRRGAHVASRRCSMVGWRLLCVALVISCSGYCLLMYSLPSRLFVTYSREQTLWSCHIHIREDWAGAGAVLRQHSHECIEIDRLQRSQTRSKQGEEHSMCVT